MNQNNTKLVFLRPNGPGITAVAHVTINGKTVTVLSDKIDDAVLYLHGVPAPGERIDVSILYGIMSRAEFESLPEWR
ncbi:hypothetical protein [Duganella vulcania]|uniref:Uncharacterized protein n=1 Tax=Duganella vulcania TaxID=2692166 RepID=A0A845GGP8_9BURK|nr:hypothetical protein [Duganella vulcania]MYM92426.1 hypothetical protein [Duganella vulcania]